MTDADFPTIRRAECPRERNYLSRSRVRRFSVVSVVLALGGLLSACGGHDVGLNGSDQTEVQRGQQTSSTPTVLESGSYAAQVGADRQASVVDALGAAVQRLRAASSGGWQLRQDDSTGAGSELSGGVITYPPGTNPITVVRRFLDAHGDVFGLTTGARQVSLPAAVALDAQGIATIRATQSLRGVPIEGTSVLVLVRHARTRPEIGFARAHIYPDIDAAKPVDTTALIAAAAALKVSADHGAAPGGPALLVVTSPDASPTLAWKIDATYSPPDGQVKTPQSVDAGPVTVYVDAHTGEILRLTRRSAIAFRANPVEALGGGGVRVGEVVLPAAGTPVEVSGTVRGGVKVTLTLERLADGTIAFIDSSQPNANRKTGTGMNVVFDGAGLQSYSDLPGTVATMKEGAVPDLDTLTAAWAAKTVLDYYRTEQGRASWDGKGAPLVSTVHTAEAIVDCNAAFVPDLSQMIYSGPCVMNGKKVTDSLVDLSIVGHEITHGITGTAAPAISEFSGQGAALNEGNSDYFGVVIQDRTTGKSYSTQGVSSCEGQPESDLCHPFPDGVSGGRNVDSGAIFDDAQFVLREPLGLLDKINDIGSAHSNSIIWTNALWQIRKAFASEDGGNLVTSKAAARFDRIVYRAITTYFTSETDMPAAASAVLQAATDLDATGAERDLIQQQFTISQLCLGCTTPAKTQQPVAVTPRIEHRPAILDSGIAYIEQLAPTTDGGDPTTRSEFVPFASPAQPAALAPAADNTFTLAGAGSWVVESRYRSVNDAWCQLTNVVTGKTERLGDFSLRLAPPAISKDTVVWAGATDSGYQINARRTTGGTVSTLDVASPLVHLAVDGNLIAFQTDDGVVSTWDLQTKEETTLARFSPFRAPFRLLRNPGDLAVSGRHVAVLGNSKNSFIPQTVVLFDVDAKTTDVLSKRAFPSGVAIDGNNVVWSEIVGRQNSGVSKFLNDPVADSDLAVYAIDSKTTSIALKERGQQGFPSIVGRRLAWQDSLAGGDDIYTAELPPEF